MPHDKHGLSLASWASDDTLCQDMSAKRMPIHTLPAKVDKIKSASYMPRQAIPVFLSRLCGVRAFSLFPAPLMVSRIKWRAIVDKDLVYTSQPAMVFLAFVQEC